MDGFVTVLSVPVVFWILGDLLIAMPYFWFTRTNPSMSPLERRLRAGALGMGWPYFVVRKLLRRREAAASSAATTATSQRILGG